MRTRKEILADVTGVLSSHQNQQLIIEILLDIRELQSLQNFEQEK